MSAYGRIIKKTFLKRIARNTRRGVLIKAATGSPNGSLTGAVGNLCFVVADNDCYICTAAPNTWVKINA